MNVHRDAAMTAVRRPGRRPAAVETILVHPVAMARALALTGGDPRRIRPMPDGCVVVQNYPGQVAAWQARAAVAAAGAEQARAGRRAARAARRGKRGTT